MAGRAAAPGRAGIALLAAALALAATFILADRSPARIGTSCDPGGHGAEFDINDDGEASKVSLGYTFAPASNDTIGFKAKDGDGGGSGGSCGGAEWLFLTVQLGDQADRLRQDGKKPQVNLAGGIPSSVDVEAYGGAGPDELIGHAGRDDLFGEGGRDTIDVRGGGADLADCGPGNDTLLAGANDVSFNCEN